MSNPVVYLPELNEKDREDLLIQMSEQTRKINVAFHIFHEEVFQLVKKIDHERLITGLANDIKFTNEDRTTAEVFRKVLHHCSYFNYDILEMIIKMFKLDENPLKKYLKTFSQFCQAMPCIEEVCGSNNSTSGRTKVTFKLDKIERHKLTYQELRQLKGKIAGHLGIRPSALYFCFIKGGCILIESLIPTFIIERVFPLSDSQMIGLYNELKVKNITVDHPFNTQVSSCPLQFSTIRGEPERAPNSGETYGKFTVPMYVRECICSDMSSTCSSRCTHARARECMTGNT